MDRTQTLKNKKPHYHYKEPYRTPRTPRESPSIQDSGIKQYVDLISEERGSYPYKYRYIPSTGQVLMEYSTMKTLKETADQMRQQQKLEKEKKKQQEEAEKQEVFLQQITGFLQQQNTKKPSFPFPNNINSPTTNKTKYREPSNHRNVSQTKRRHHCSCYTNYKRQPNES